MNINKSSVVILLLVIAACLPQQTIFGYDTKTVASPVQVTQADHLMYLPIMFNPNPEFGEAWPTVAANPQRTSWSAEEVSGNLHIEWYRPIEAYIPQNVQIIASDGLLFVSTARGLYALRAGTGDLAWRFDTQLPLGNSPTVDDGVVYVGGYDKKIHALEVHSGTHLWSFDQAKAGYSANPLVINGIVLAGNRDGYMYAIGAHGTQQQGQLLWKFKAGGAILISPAYRNGIIYFAASDNFAYALSISNGALVWKSAKMPGDSYQAFWPVIYNNYVIFSGSQPYRDAAAIPGVGSILGSDGNPYSHYDRLQKDDVFRYPEVSAPSTIGPVISDTEPWSHGRTVIDGSRLSEYLEDNPNPSAHSHKPWRRVYTLLNISNGMEYTMDVDGDHYADYPPFGWWGTHSGNSHPPIVGADGVLYLSNPYRSQGTFWDIPQGRIMGWKFGTSHLSIIGGGGALDEPQAISGGGNIIYRNLLCDRIGDYYKLEGGGGVLWDYARTLANQAPGYDAMWVLDPGGDPSVRLKGAYGNENGIYHNHGLQNPIIPYNQRLYVHRGNSIIAYGSGSALSVELPMITINPATDTLPTPSKAELIQRLEAEIQRIVNAGDLKPGYYNWAQTANQYGGLADYYDNPGDTLYTLARAYPFLSTGLQQQVKSYLKSQFSQYFNPVMFARKGWADGAQRESVTYPPEIESNLTTLEKKIQAEPYVWSWSYPPHNFYAMWKYSQLFPEDALVAYNLAKNKLQVPLQVSNSYFEEWPYELNAYIAGYIGFLNLQQLANQQVTDGQLRTAVTNELNRLLQLRVTIFTKDTYWPLSTDNGSYHYRVLNISRNFIFMVPELGEYLRNNKYQAVMEAVQEYNWVAPYWFVSRYEANSNESALATLYDYNSLFSAKAYILREPAEELNKYLDVPAFIVGDLFYIQNLITIIDASS